MQIFMIIVLAFLAASKAAVQGMFAKTMKTIADNFLFNFLMFLAIVIVFIAIFGFGLPSPVTFLCATVFGIASVTFQFTYTNAFKNGSVALTVFVNSFHLIFPIILSAVLYDEFPKATQYIGILLIVLSLYLVIIKKDGEQQNINLKWIISVLFCTICAGCTVSAQKVHQHTVFNAEYSQFIVSAYIISAILSFAVFVYYKFIKKEETNIKINIKTLEFAGILGIILGAYNSGILYYSGIVPSVILMPTVNVSSILFSTIYGAFLFKERLNRNQKAGLLVGIISIALLTI